MQEIWIDIKEYEGLYQVSNLGRVKSLLFNKEKILKPALNERGYLHIILNKDKTHKTFRVHRLVANAFIPNPQNKPQVNHIDGNKHNNEVNNLEWCSSKENIEHAYLNKLSKNKKTILQYDMNDIFIKEWDGLREAARSLNISKSSIYNCCRHKMKSAGGFIWKYKV